MARLIRAAEPIASRRRAYFHLVIAADGITPAPSEAGGQPEASKDGAAFDPALIGTLVAIGDGRYYAVLDPAAIATAGATSSSTTTTAAPTRSPTGPPATSGSPAQSSAPTSPPTTPRAGRRPRT